jgi:hypothetical protein
MTERIAAARAMLAPRADPQLAGQVLAARATLGDPAARAEYAYAGSPRSSREQVVLPGSRPVYTCHGCRKIVSGPEARCKSCGWENARNVSGRARTIR